MWKENSTSWKENSTSNMVTKIKLRQEKLSEGVPSIFLMETNPLKELKFV